MPDSPTPLKTRPCECQVCCCNAPARPDPHVLLWLCDHCWFHTDPADHVDRIK